LSNHERVIAVIPKGRRNVIRVTLSALGGHPVIGIRQHEPNGLRALVPTAKGISNIDFTAARQLAQAIEAAFEEVMT
jgi:hypothetical protein